MDVFTGNFGHISNILAHIAGFKTKTFLKRINTNNFVQKLYFLRPKKLFVFQKLEVDTGTEKKIFKNNT